MTTTRKPEQGFTLIELMVVIVVMGIVFAITIPSFSSYIRSSRLNGAASTLMDDMRLARSLASAQRRTYMLRRTGRGYTLVGLSPATTVLSRTMPGTVQFSAVDSTTFFAWGLTQPATITLQQSGKSAVLRLTSAGQVTRD